MSMWTVCFGQIGLNPSPIGVLASCEQPEMVGVNAASVSTHMVNVKAVNQIAIEQPERQLMGVNVDPFAKQSSLVVKTSISTLADLTLPNPAVGASNKAGLNRGVCELYGFNEAVQQWARLSPVSSSHTCNKNQAGSPKVNRAHVKPQLENRLVKLIPCFCRFMATKGSHA